MAAVIGFSFKERFLRFQLLFLDFYHFHHVIWRRTWAKKLKTKKGQNILSGPFSHEEAHLFMGLLNSCLGTSFSPNDTVLVSRRPFENYCMVSKQILSSN